MVDSDMVFTTLDILEVLRVSRSLPTLSVVGGVCPALNPDGTKWVVAAGDGTTGTVAEADRWTELPDEPFRVSFTGAAFLLVPRRILELFPRVGDAKNPLEVADLGTETTPTQGTGVWFSPTYRFRNAEDYSFCDRLQAYGVPLIIAPKARIGHTKHATIYP
jgi:GT2 family glycosyltransferase